ncbi:hypothetical protein [Siphonobacter aquaeclarae]|jgi:Na+-driven multidrug efflux pump|uniref:DUF3311 domain-containing protein n=1 Tax=Siphonobacter aquaeclarae TaxID=563176 RepID=A0A1G9KP93_9BACT|nr:hypothetical protein [Siphonobacter aquaeclarae]MBO9638431.1 hypothetical protein [Siphonobacter aquaeclarae]SDL51492.1 hypothetical protein SAMN04488090_1092 [Siphonobacter aquaeclarae]
MNERLRAQYLLIVSVLFGLILNFPLLSLFNQPVIWLGIPLLYWYLFVVWLALVGLMYWYWTRRNHE